MKISSSSNNDNDKHTDHDGEVSLNEFIARYQKIDPNASTKQLEQLFKEADNDGSGTLSFNEFLTVAAQKTKLAAAPKFSSDVAADPIIDAAALELPSGSDVDDAPEPPHHAGHPVVSLITVRKADAITLA